MVWDPSLCGEGAGTDLFGKFSTNDRDRVMEVYKVVKEEGVRKEEGEVREDTVRRYNEER